MTPNPTLSDYGIYSLSDLANDPVVEEPELIPGLIGKGSVNLLVGDSGLGKTPLGMQLGIALAGGTEFLSMPCVDTQGPVLYIDAESPKSGFRDTAIHLMNFLGLPENVPFYGYSHNWDYRTSRPAFWDQAIVETLERVRPVLVIVDPLRAVWPFAETKSDEAAALVARLRNLTKQFGCAWIITHHVRKTDMSREPADLLSDPHGWLQEAAGTRALITGMDTRIGVAGSTGEADLLMCGYTRLKGTLPPMRIQRIKNEDGLAVGYSLLSATSSLSPKWLEFLGSLPMMFRAQEAKDHFKSDSTAYRFLEACTGAGLISRDSKTKLFLKINAANVG